MNQFGITPVLLIIQVTFLSYIPIFQREWKIFSWGLAAEQFKGTGFFGFQFWSYLLPLSFHFPALLFAAFDIR